MRIALPAVLAVVMVASGCGEDTSPRAAVSPEQEVLERVTGFWDAVEAGDGEAACEAVTEPGQRLFVRWGADAPSGAAPETCPDAVAELSDAMAERGGEPVTGAGGSFSADDVSIDGEKAEVQCEYRGAILLRRLGGEWLVRVPACTD
jgi:hypothetical protein